MQSGGLLELGAGSLKAASTAYEDGTIRLQSPARTTQPTTQWCGCAPSGDVRIFARTLELEPAEARS